MDHSSDSSLFVGMGSDYSSSPLARQACEYASKGREIATFAIDIIDGILFHSDAVEILKRQPSSSPSPNPQDENHDKNPAVAPKGKIKVEADDDERPRGDSQRSIKKLTNAIMRQIALKPVPRAVMTRIDLGWNRRRASTAISILTGTEVVRVMGGSDGFRRLLVLNKNTLILSQSTKQLISNYNTMKQWEQLLQRQLTDMMTLFSSLHRVKDSVQPPETKKPRTETSDPHNTTAKL